MLGDWVSCKAAFRSSLERGSLSMRSKAVAPIIASFLLTSIACSSGDGGTTEERLCVSLVRLAASQPSSVKVSRIQTDVGNPPKVTTVEFTMSGGQSERVVSMSRGTIKMEARSERASLIRFTVFARRETAPKVTDLERR